MPEIYQKGGRESGQAKGKDAFLTPAALASRLSTDT
jgi:hypothetical protein